MRNINWETVIGTIAGSGLVSSIVNRWMNHRTTLESIKESGLYKKRAEVMDEMISILEELNFRIQLMIDPIQTEGSDESEEERRNAVIESFKHFQTVIQNKQHYLPQKTASILIVISVKYNQLIDKYDIRVRPKGLPSNIDEWEKVLDMSHELQPLIGNLKNDFRKLMGVK